MRAGGALAGIAAVALVATIASSPAASTGSITIKARVAASTALDAADCSSAAATQFGTLLPGSGAVTSDDCTVEFGSSNSTATLTMSQDDSSGRAMTAPVTGADAGFGAGGIVSWPVGVGNVTSYSGIVDSKGRVIASDYRSGGGQPMSATRMTAAGAPDGSFGTGGLAEVLVGTTAVSYSTAVQADDKVLLGGFAYAGAGTGNDLAVVRLEEDGDLDPTFATGGRLLLPLSSGSGTDIAFNLAVRPDGRILVIAQMIESGPGTWSTVVLQLSKDGELDTYFGTDGIATIAAGIVGTNDAPLRAKLDSAGRLVVTGYTADGNWAYAGTTYRDGYVARLTREGRLDTTFNGTGIRIISYNPTDYAYAVAIDPGGDLLVGVRTQNGADNDVYIHRMDAAGVDVPGFNGGLPVVINVNTNDWIGDIAIDARGKVLLGLMVRPVATNVNRLQVLNADGSVDNTFSGDSHEDLVAGTTDAPRSVFLADGGAVLIGSTTVGARTQPYAARFSAPTIADYAGGSADWSVGASGMFGSCLREVASATGTWTVDADADCTDVGTDPWRAVPASTSPAAHVATTALGVTGTASMRFGMRVADAQPPGAYSAGISFSVIAP
ncbi:MAG: hypothetical protein JWM90_2943 [Thermoleophilia bacterium]|nr:hypothetical protein [Thermoleophilia bacterium]